jgi:hypothetical protein
MEWVRVSAVAVLAGAASWWAMGRGPVDVRGLEAFDRPPREAQVGAADAGLERIRSLASLNLFPAVSEGAGAQGAAASGALKLIGIALTPARRAALVSVGGATPQWIAMGEPAAGLELIELHATRAVIRSASGQTTALDLFPPLETAAASDAASQHASR